jgi:3-hydroxyisobutyrate dehydrogenase-like beta-hydroxyacid dehydrogenase
MSKKIGIIGLGRCGLPAAARYIQGGYEVFGYARRPEVIKKFTAQGGVSLANPAEVARQTDVVIIMVLNDEQVIDVVSGAGGILEGAVPGGTVICMSTINRSNLEMLADACGQRQLHFVDCPFTGGPARVEKGTLTLIAAAPETVLEKSRMVLEVLGKITVVGHQPGMGQAVKHCNQLMVTTIHAATIEVIALAEKTGVDPKIVCDVVGSGIGGNDYFRLVSRAILDHTASPGGLGQLWKDINIVITSARKHNLPLLVATATSHYFNMAVSQGMVNDDSIRLMDVIRKMMGDPVTYDKED